MPPLIQLHRDDTILFIGDSITDAERHRRGYAPLGLGYVHFAGNLLLAKYPSLDLRLINRGVSGDTVRDMSNRWDKDCLVHRPNILSVLIGINDVWRMTMEPDREASSSRDYEQTYERLLARVKEECDCQLVLMEPFVFCSDSAHPVFKSVTPYVEAVRQLAAKFHAVLVPLQRKIHEQIPYVPAEKWSQDTVHPLVWAHAWIAQRWLDATGL